MVLHLMGAGPRDEKGASDQRKDHLTGALRWIQAEASGNCGRDRARSGGGWDPRACAIMEESITWRTHMSGLLLENKNAVIYGGGGAIGGAIARVFAREGGRVFIAGR